MRCKEALALATFTALTEMGGEWAKQAQKMDEDELARIGRRMQRQQQRGTYTGYKSLQQLVSKR